MDYYTCARRYPNKMLNQWEQPSSLANEYIHESVQGVCDNNQHSADVGASQNRLGVLSCVRRRPQEISSRRCMMNGTDKGDRMQKARKAINVTSLSPGLLHSPLHLKLLEAFLQSFQYLGDIPEPAIGDIGADSLLLQTGAETWSAIHGLELGSSILLAFVEKEKGRFQCMICGKFKNSRCRALGCVRACLDYRPFVCPGRGAGCETIRLESTQSGGPLLHQESAGRPHQGPNEQSSLRGMVFSGCRTELMLTLSSFDSFRRGGMFRHWKARHASIPFPTDIYPLYNGARSKRARVLP